MTPAATRELDATIEALRAAYAARRPQSKTLHERARSTLPGGNTRTQVFFPPFPFYVANAQGCWLEDVDGLHYRDLVNNYTSLVHGHAYPAVVEAIAAQAARGTAYGAPSLGEVRLAEALTARVASMEQVRFTNSGTEAVLMAVKTARIATGRDLVVKLEGSYHGGAESVQLTVGSLGTPGEVVAEPGVPVALTGATRILPVDDPEAAVAALRDVGPRAAALIVEPMLGGTTMVPLGRELLASLASVAREHGSLVIFDEVLTFRLAYGGLQAEYGIAPDLTALGKIIGGGLPVGAFGGRRDLLEVWDPGRTTPRYAAGTFNANPLTMAAGLAALEALTPAAIGRINTIGGRLRTGFNETARRYGIPLVASGHGSILQLHEGVEVPGSHRERASRGRQVVECMFLRLLERGVFITARGTANVSTALTDADVAAAEDAFADALGETAATVGGGG